MSFISIEFLLFVAGVFLFYYIFPLRYRWIVLLCASIIFYAIYSGYLILCIFVTTVIIYLAGLLIQKYNSQFKSQKNKIEKSERKRLKDKIKKQKKCVVAFATVIVVGILVFLKYFNFFGEIIDGIAFYAGGGKKLVPTVNFILPIGISYYTLMAISYVVDIYRGVNYADKNFLRLFLFLIYFPQIVEGPIGRYNLLAKQLYNGNRFDYDNVRQSCLIVLWGFFKKLVIADRCAIYVNEVFNHSSQYGGLTVLLAIVLYTFEIYMDFSGCIDIVSGVSGLFGIKLSENFKRPFFSKSIDEFWKRWHITLGAFFRDYIFYPVSLTKTFSKINTFCRKHMSKNFARVIPMSYALFFVWFCNGLWHGASFKYIFYGLYYYFIMVIAQLSKPLTDRILRVLHINIKSKSYNAFQIIRTTAFVCVGMLIFRAESLVSAFNMFISIFTRLNISVSSITAPMVATDMRKASFILIILSMIIIFIVGLIQQRGICISRSIISVPFYARWVLYIASVLTVIILGVYGAGYDASSFIYGQF